VAGAPALAPPPSAPPVQALEGGPPPSPRSISPGVPEPPSDPPEVPVVAPSPLPEAPVVAPRPPSELSVVTRVRVGTLACWAGGGIGLASRLRIRGKLSLYMRIEAGIPFTRRVFDAVGPDGASSEAFSQPWVMGLGEVGVAWTI